MALLELAASCANFCKLPLYASYLCACMTSCGKGWSSPGATQCSAILKLVCECVPVCTRLCVPGTHSSQCEMQVQVCLVLQDASIVSMHFRQYVKENNDNFRHTILPPEMPSDLDALQMFRCTSPASCTHVHTCTKSMLVVRQG